MKKLFFAVLLVQVFLMNACGERKTPVEKEDKTVGTIISGMNSPLYRVTAIHTYNPDGEEIRYTRCKYDDHGNMVSLSSDWGVYEEIWNEQLLIYEYDIGKIDGKTDQEWICRYDEKGTVDYEKRITYRNDGSYSDYELTYKTEYDQSGYLINLVREGETEYEYSNNVHGYPLVVIERDIFTDSERKYAISYIEENSISEIRIAGRDESDKFEIHTIIMFEYTEDGSLGRISYEGSANEGYEFKYDKAGRLEKMYKLDSENKQESMTEFSYDKEGRIKRKNEYDGSGNLIQYSEYEFEAYTLPEEEYQELVSRETWQWYMELLDLRYLQRGRLCSRYFE